MTVAIYVAFISGLVAIIGVVLSSYATIRTIRLRDELDLRRYMLDRSNAIEEAMSKYRDPLLRSAIDLQGRIYGLIESDYMGRHLRSDDIEMGQYAKTSTLYRLAEYFGWVEILRRGVQFLDFGDQARGRDLTILLHRIGFAFANTHRFPDAAFRLFRDEQRAVGEVVLEPLPGDPRGYRCIGYTQFVERLETDPNFSRWFNRLIHDMEAMMDPAPGYMDRLAAVHNILIALLEFLDPGGIRYPTFDRPELVEPAPLAEA